MSFPENETFEATAVAPAVAETPVPTDDELRTRAERLAVRAPLTDERVEALRRAVQAGVDETTFFRLAEARRLSRSAEITLPKLRYEDLSRGRGWCRHGRGKAVQWATRVEGGYRVATPGLWVVGASDGFSRRDSVIWDVEHVQVGTETWTVAS